MTSPKNARSVNGRRFYTYRGQQFESVTSLLGAGYPKEWLKFWSAKMVAELAFGDRSWLDLPEEEAVKFLKGAPWRKRDKAGDHGTVVHEALAALARGATTYKATEDYRPHVKAVGEFWSMFRPTPLYVESQVYSLTHGYAGSFDLLAWIYGRLLLIDAKTAADLGHDMRLQLAAYLFADFIGEDDNVIAPMPTVHGAAVLWIPRENPTAWQLIEVDAGQQELRDFLTVKAIADITSRHEAASIGEQILPQAVEAIA